MLRTLDTLGRAAQADLRQGGRRQGLLLKAPEERLRGLAQVLLDCGPHLLVRGYRAGCLRRQLRIAACVWPPQRGRANQRAHQHALAHDADVLRRQHVVQLGHVLAKLDVPAQQLRCQGA